MAMDDIRADLRDESNGELVALLREEIERDGRITFARFMEHTLGHPAFGYYAAGSARPGFGGDFLTGPETHPIFGAALARQIAECWDRMGRPDPFVVREAGAGSGTLARDILRGLVDERADTLDALRYELSDVSDARVSEGLTRLEDAGFASSIARGTSDPVTGVLVANELLDAFPVHRLIVERGILREMYVVWRDGWFVEETGELSDPRFSESLEGLDFMEGQRIEVSPAAWEWARGIGAQLTRGYALLIDYGYPARELYDPRERFEGTLRTYSQHLVSDDPYRRVGRQDLTAHVDFSAVSRAAEEGGCSVLGLTSQAFFFAGLGIEELLLKMQRDNADGFDYLNARETIMHLLDPRSLGRFRVLVLGKDVPAEPPLRGLSFSM